MGGNLSWTPPSLAPASEETNFPCLPDPQGLVLKVANVQGYVVYLATSATGANRIWSLGEVKDRDDVVVLHAMSWCHALATRKLQLRVSYTTATASVSRNGTEVEDANASNDTAVDSDEDDSDTIIYNTLTDVGPLPRV